MLSTFHDDAVVVFVDKLEGSGRRVAHRNGAHIHRAWCTADGPSPQKGRRCSPSSVWAVHSQNWTLAPTERCPGEASISRLDTVTDTLEPTE